MVRSTEDKVLAGISHLGIAVGWVGLIIAMVIYILRKDQSLFVTRNAKQAMGYQVCVLVIMQVLVLIFGGSLVLGIFGGQALTVGTVGLVLTRLLNLAFILLGVLGAVRAFLGEYFHYPLIGEFVERL